MTQNSKQSQNNKTKSQSVPSRTFGHDILLRASASTLLCPGLY